MTTSSLSDKDLAVYLATCPDEVKQALQRELEALGASECELGFRSVRFCADLPAAYRIHMASRLASQLLLQVRECAATSPMVITAQAKRVKWEHYLRPGATYRIDAVSGDRDGPPIRPNHVSRAVRLGFEDYWSHKGFSPVAVDLKEPQILFVAYTRGGRLQLWVQTTGKAMHKRGYRSGSAHPAPLKETLAAALLDRAGYDGSQTLWDPMCGSGTLGIEACSLALGKASLIHRKLSDYALERMPLFDRELWRQTSDELRLATRSAPVASVVLSDIDPSYVAEAQANALRARVERYITFRSGSVFGQQPPEPPGILLSNLPYGERLAQGAGLAEFYRNLGAYFKKHCAGWKVYLLVDVRSPWRQMGLRPNGSWDYKNGAIAVKLVRYEMF